jgi:hypothetical protein
MKKPYPADEPEEEESISNYEQGLHGVKYSRKS